MALSGSNGRGNGVSVSFISEGFGIHWIDAPMTKRTGREGYGGGERQIRIFNPSQANNNFCGMLLTKYSLYD
jgi:hypothetical protein